VFIPPLLVAGIFGVIAASLTAKLLNKYRLSKYFIYPQLVMVALMVIYTLLFGWIIMPF
jgi:predicted MFS family arabinose efflux permease